MGWRMLILVENSWCIVLFYSWRNLVICLSPFKLQSITSDVKKILFPYEFVAVDIFFCFITAQVFHIIYIFFQFLYLLVMSFKEKKNIQKWTKVFLSVLCRCTHMQLIWSAVLLKAPQYYEYRVGRTSWSFSVLFLLL